MNIFDRLVLVLVLLTLAACAGGSSGDNPGNSVPREPQFPAQHTGTDFWFTVPPTFRDDVDQIIVQAEEAATISISGPSFFGDTFTALPETPAEIRVGFGRAEPGDAFHLESDRPVSVVVFRSQTYSATDAFRPLPTANLGTEYYVASWPAGDGNFDYPSYVLVTATESDTEVSFTTPCLGEDSTSAGTDVVENLASPGSTLMYSCSEVGADLTGMKIVSDKPVQVIAGNKYGRIPSDAKEGGMLVESLLPVSSWGTEFFASSFVGSEDHRYRILASENETKVTVREGNGNESTYDLDAGDFAELTSNQLLQIQGDKPILAMQYAVGLNENRRDHPSMLMLVPVERFQKSARIYSQPGPNGPYAALLIAANGTEGSIKVNGATPGGFADLPGGGYRAALVSIGTGESNITSDYPFGVQVVGFHYVTSYAYPGAF